MLSSKDNFTVEEIVISDDQMQELNSILKKSTVSTKSKRMYIRSVMGGTCSACYDIPPTKKVTYDDLLEKNIFSYYFFPRQVQKPQKGDNGDS